MNFFVSKNVDVCGIRRNAKSDHPESVTCTVFTDEPLETRRKVEVTLTPDLGVNNSPESLVVTLADGSPAQLIGVGRNGYRLDLDPQGAERLTKLLTPVGFRPSALV